MEENTQLPKEVVECINNWIVTFALAYHKRKDKDISNDAAEFITDELSMPNALTAYATKLHQVEKENEQLRGWKMEAAELLTKIHSYAHKHLEIKLGQCTVEFVIGRAKERDELKEENAKLKEQATGWRPLLEDVLKVTKDKYMYYRIKKFLYGE